MSFRINGDFIEFDGYLVGSIDPSLPATVRATIEHSLDVSEDVIGQLIEPQEDLDSAGVAYVDLERENKTLKKRLEAGVRMPGPLTKEQQLR